MGLDFDKLASRREALALGLGLAIAGLSGCGINITTKGSYDDGYADGYAAGLAAGKDTSTDASDGSQVSDIPSSGIEYTINTASLGFTRYPVTGDGTVLVLDMTAKNVSDQVASIYFGDVLSAYQDGKGLMWATNVEGYEHCNVTDVKPGVTLDGWVAYELLDTTTPVELEAKTSQTGEMSQVMYGLTNPRTVDLTQL